jgi:hypothetical protein
VGVRLWSPKGNLEDGGTHIGLTSGHTMIIPNDRKGIEVPPRFRKEAIARGCLPVGMEPDEEEVDGGFSRARIIREALTKMMDSSEEGMFTTSGKPVLAKVSKLAGFTVERSELNQIWTQVEKGEGGEDDKPSTTAVTS